MQIAKNFPWNKSNREIAEMYGTCSRRIWYWRKRLKKVDVESKRGPEVLDVSDWDWRLSNGELARIHGLTRQGVFYHRKRVMLNASPMTKAAFMRNRFHAGK